MFGVFFAADMAGFVAEMWRLVRPGGVLAIATGLVRRQIGSSAAVLDPLPIHCPNRKQ